MTEVLQASQSHWGLLLRNEAVSPFSISMSNSVTFLIIEQHFVTYHFSHQQLEKIFPALSKCNLFLLFGSYSGVGRRRRQSECQRMATDNMPYLVSLPPYNNCILGGKVQESHTAIRRNVDVLSTSYPIVTLRGHGGGIKLADWYEPGKIQLTAAQMDLLLRISKTLTGSDAHIMRSIISQFSGPKKKR